MNNTIKRIGNWFLAHKKTLMVLAVVVVAFVHPELAHAGETSGDNSETVRSMAELANLLVKFLNTLLWPLLLIIGDLLDVDMITGPGMEERLIAIWVEMRNLVNIALALFLVVVAFYNVLGLGGGEGELAIKTALPKIVLGLVLVNFTYVGGKVILDVANVGTTIAFSLPQVMQQSSGSQFQVTDQLADFEQEICYPSQAVGVGPDGTSGTDDDVTPPSYYTKTNAPIQTKLFCELIETDSTEAPAAAEPPAAAETATALFLESVVMLAEDAAPPAESGPATTSTTTASGPGKDEYGGLRESLASLYFRDLNKNNVAIVMATNMGSLGRLELFKEGAIKDFSDLTVNTIFALVMYAVFAVSYVVLAAVLIVRLVVLWLALALSPLAVLTYVIPQIKEWLGGGGDFAQKVVKHLVAPIIIGLTFSMGFMLMDGWSVVSKNSMSVYADTKVGDVISSEFLVSGIDDLPKLILAIASVVVVWMGVFAAANDTYASGITEKIKEYGGMAKTAAIGGAMALTTLPISVSGEPNEKLSLAGLKTIFKGGLDQLSTGGPLPAEMERLRKSDNWLVRFSLGGERDKGSATQSQNDMAALLGTISDNGDKTNTNEAIKLAGHLANIIGKNKHMTTDDSTAMSREFTALQDSLKRGVVHEPKVFQEIIDKYKDNKGKDGKALGLEGLDINQSSYTSLGNIREIKKVEIEDADAKAKAAADAKAKADAADAAKKAQASAVQSAPASGQTSTTSGTSTTTTTTAPPPAGSAAP